MGAWLYFKANKLLLYYCIRHSASDRVKDKITWYFHFVTFAAEMGMLRLVIFNSWQLWYLKWSQLLCLKIDFPINTWGRDLCCIKNLSKANVKWDMSMGIWYSYFQRLQSAADLLHASRKWAKIAGARWVIVKCNYLLRNSCQKRSSWPNFIVSTLLIKPLGFSLLN